MYISNRAWRDLTDGHLYREGEPFPFDGREVPVERLAELETGRNQAKMSLIRAADADMGQEQGRKKEAPERANNSQETAAEKPKRTRRK